MSSSDPRDALKDMVHSLKGIFGKYDRRARKDAWASLTSSEGQKTVKRLLDSPKRPVVGIPRLLRFKEWFNESANGS
jgi:hypothetical protein